MAEEISVYDSQHTEQKSVVRVLEEKMLLTNLTDELIEVVSQIRYGGAPVRQESSESACVEQSSSHAHERIELMFSKLQYLIRVHQLPPRFIATLDESYRFETGRNLKTDLASSGRVYDQVYQTAIDVATGKFGVAHPQFTAGDGASA